MKFKLRWWTSGNMYYAPLCEGDGYVPAFYIEKQKDVLIFIEIRFVHTAIKEQYIEVFEDEGGADVYSTDGYSGGGAELDECNRLVNLPKNRKTSIVSLFYNEG